MKSNPTLQILGLWRCPSAIGNWLGAIVSSVVLCHSTLPCTAGLPEPYNLIYGAIEMDGKWVTAADTNVTVEARRLPTGAAIASYRMGSQSAATNFYALKVRLESPAPADIMKARKVVDEVYMDERIEKYIVDIVFATRDPKAYRLDEITPLIQYGASPRATISLALASKAYAFINGRGYVTPQDVKSIGMDVLRHRVIPTYEAEAENVNSETVLNTIFEAIEVP